MDRWLSPALDSLRAGPHDGRTRRSSKAIKRSDEIKALLDRPNYGHLATVMADGSPSVDNMNDLRRWWPRPEAPSP